MKTKSDNNCGFLFHLQKQWKLGITFLPSTATPGFESIVKIQVCHFVDQQFQNAGLILWSL